MRITVVGAGSWGTALAIHLAQGSGTVRLWAREREIVDGIRRERRNPLFLSELTVPQGVEAHSDVAQAVDGADVIVFVVPVQFARVVLAEMRQSLLPSVTFVSASKGIEVNTLQCMDELVTGELALAPGAFVALSGPSFAREVAAGLPAAAVLAGSDEGRLRVMRQAFSTPAFRFYSTDDVVGVELAGALKNVIAIAAGIATGQNLGHNALAALLTRGLHEITRLGVRLGGSPETFRGLAGMGDLVLTCTGHLSRNRSVGERLGRGEVLADILSGREVPEGPTTTRAAAALARKHGVEMPITFAIEAILAGRLSIRDAVVSLMTRELKNEAIL